ncbi:MAG: hypothetical protein NZ480_05955 [Bdellovibrionaceae bacterium]|nr:hypothetical protein [Pseudobdellovibrionaceae bacterium]MDW8190474.1 hypothetical protein [Pseudobdellovibrionaceae bacterium]
MIICKRLKILGFLLIFLFLGQPLWATYWVGLAQNFYSVETTNRTYQDIRVPQLILSYQLNDWNWGGEFLYFEALKEGNQTLSFDRRYHLIQAFGEKLWELSSLISFSTKLGVGLGQESYRYRIYSDNLVEYSDWNPATTVSVNLIFILHPQFNVRTSVNHSFNSLFERGQFGFQIALFFGIL